MRTDDDFIAQWADKPIATPEDAMAYPDWAVVALVCILFAGVMVASAMS